jgi:hypothetical protein
LLWTRMFQYQPYGMRLQARSIYQGVRQRQGLYIIFSVTQNHDRGTRSEGPPASPKLEKHQGQGSGSSPTARRRMRTTSSMRTLPSP